MSDYGSIASWIGNFGLVGCLLICGSSFFIQDTIYNSLEGTVVSKYASDDLWWDLKLSNENKPDSKDERFKEAKDNSPENGFRKLRNNCLSSYDEKYGWFKDTRKEILRNIIRDQCSLVFEDVKTTVFLGTENNSGEWRRVEKRIKSYEEVTSVHEIDRYKDTGYLELIKRIKESKLEDLDGEISREWCGRLKGMYVTNYATIKELKRVCFLSIRERLGDAVLFKGNNDRGDVESVLERIKDRSDSDLLSMGREVFEIKKIFSEGGVDSAVSKLEKLCSYLYERGYSYSSDKEWLTSELACKSVTRGG